MDYSGVQTREDGSSHPNVRLDRAVQNTTRILERLS